MGLVGGLGVEVVGEAEDVVEAGEVVEPGAGDGVGAVEVARHGAGDGPGGVGVVAEIDDGEEGVGEVVVVEEAPEAGLEGVYDVAGGGDARFGEVLEVVEGEVDQAGEVGAFGGEWFAFQQPADEGLGVAEGGGQVLSLDAAQFELAEVYAGEDAPGMAVGDGGDVGDHFDLAFLVEVANVGDEGGYAHEGAVAVVVFSCHAGQPGVGDPGEVGDGTEGGVPDVEGPPLGRPESVAEPVSEAVGKVAQVVAPAKGVGEAEGEGGVIGPFRAGCHGGDGMLS